MRAPLRCRIDRLVEPWFGDAGQTTCASSVNDAATREGGRYVDVADDVVADFGEAAIDDDDRLGTRRG
jgi:hypothetical protein